MKNILVPTDFSANAKGAFLYAQDLAIYLNANISVVHISHPNLNTSYYPAPIILDDEIEFKRSQLKKFVSAGTEKDIAAVFIDHKIESNVISGYAAEEIIKLSGQEDVDLIVMGSTGQSNVLEKIFGSVSSVVAQRAQCPVLLVPQGTSFNDYKDILYASDFESSDNKTLETIADMAASFAATVHLVHVQFDKTNPDFQLEELILEQIFEERAPKAKTKYVTIWDTDVWHGINVYAQDHNIDLLVLVKPHRKFLDNLLHRSITKKIIKEINRPILILPIEN